MVPRDPMETSMKPHTQHLARWRPLAVAAAIAAGLAAPASADEADAKRLLKAMSDYMAAQTTVSFDYDSNLDVVTAEGLKIGLASSGTIALERPNKLRVTRHGGFADVELVFDGETAALYGKGQNAYATVAAPGTVGALVDTLRDTYHLPIPGGDLLAADGPEALMPMIKQVLDLGSGVIGGVECDHIAVRGEDVDLQVWIAQGDAPHPCRVAISSPGVAGQPQYTVTISDWKAGDAVGAVDYTFTPPAGATEVKIDTMTDIDELPSQFTPGEAK